MPPATGESDAKPTVSVLLPTYNGSAYLRECISSVLTQTFADFELLIGDDCSTDSTRDILSQYSDQRAKLFFRETNVGLFANINLLADQARGELVRFLCQDDALEPECLEREVEFFSRQREIAMTFCKCIVVDESSTEVERWDLFDLPEVLDSNQSLQQFLYHGSIPGNLSTVMARTTAVRRLGGFDETFRIAGDYDLWVRLCTDAALGIIHRHLLRLRRHKNQLSRAKNSTVHIATERRKIVARLLPRLPKRLRPYARQYLHRRQDVLEVHHVLRSLLRGDLAEVRGMFRAMGPKDFGAGLFWWCVTLDNRLYRPEPKFVGMRDVIG